MEHQKDHDKPIPAFYCCYLLRSTVRHASLYIGSTPNPPRRLSQHNGVAKGGAHRTAREKLRPWEMVVIVEGFTSRIAALQLEWAWQHARDSRHIKLDDEDSAHVVINPKTGKARPRARRSARSLTAHLSNLHLLLRSGYFSNWPLTVRFFCADVYRVWNLWNERADGHLPHNIQIIPDGNCGAPNDSPGNDRVGSVEHIKPDYSKIRDYLEKATFLLEDSEDLRCKVCKAQVIPMEELVLVCPQANCYCISHLKCLSETFLNAAENPDQLVPTDGICPACKETVKWPLMMQELTLRCRGEKELRSILRKKRKEDNKSSNNGQAEIHPDAVDEVDSLVQNLPTANPSFLMGKYGDGHKGDDSPLDEDWLEALEIGSESDAGDRLTTQSKQNPPRVEIVIEDSDEAD